MKWYLIQGHLNIHFFCVYRENQYFSLFHPQYLTSFLSFNTMTDTRHNISKESGPWKQDSTNNLLLQQYTWYGMNDSLHNNLQSPQCTDTAKAAQSSQHSQDRQHPRNT